MSEFKGTKGPWSRSGNAVFNDDGYDIVHLTYGEYTGIKEDEANTNLIAAAPDLLNMLQATTVYIEKNANDGSGIIRAVLDASNAAIAKALGQ